MVPGDRRRLRQAVVEIGKAAYGALQRIAARELPEDDGESVVSPHLQARVQFLFRDVFSAILAWEARDLDHYAPGPDDWFRDPEVLSEELGATGAFLDELRRALRTGGSDVRRQALARLAIEMRARPGLPELAESETWALRPDGVDELAATAASTAAPVEHRVAAIQLLGWLLVELIAFWEFAPDAADALVDLLDDPDPAVREEVATVLRSIVREVSETAEPGEPAVWERAHELDARLKPPGATARPPE